MQNQLRKAINLVKKTGDRLIVFDSVEADNVYVVLSLKDYENLILNKSGVRGLTEDELLDKINRDIAIWKNEQKNEQSFYESLNKKSEVFKQSQLDHDDEIFSNTDRPAADITKEERRGIFPRAWSIPDKRKASAEEVIEEDRQYLEEIRFN